MQTILRKTATSPTRLLSRHFHVFVTLTEDSPNELLEYFFRQAGRRDAVETKFVALPHLASYNLEEPAKDELKKAQYMFRWIFQHSAECSLQSRVLLQSRVFQVDFSIFLQSRVLRHEVCWISVGEGWTSPWELLPGRSRYPVLFWNLGISFLKIDLGHNLVLDISTFSRVVISPAIKLPENTYNGGGGAENVQQTKSAV